MNDKQTHRNTGISKGLGGFMTNHSNCNYMLVQILVSLATETGFMVRMEM